MSRARAVLFDAYGTLFDVYGVTQLAEQLFAGHGARLAQVWRDKQIEYTRLATTCNGGAHYQPFWRLTEAALRYAIKLIAVSAHPERAGGDFEPEIQQLLALYRRLPAFAESEPVLNELKARGVPTGILSNGDPAMLRDVARAADLAPLLDHLISVDTVRRYKTDASAYALGPQALGLAVQDILLVSCNAWDVLGAGWFGYQTFWINRSGAPYEEIGPPPTYTGADLRAVLPLFSSPSS